MNRVSIFNKIIILLLIFSQLFDGIFTYMGVRIGGLDVEGNPIVKYLMTNLGAAGGLILIKILAISMLSYLYTVSHRYDKKFSIVLMFIFVIYLVVLILWFRLLFIYYYINT